MNIETRSEVSAVLLKAAAEIADPKRWTKGQTQRSDDGTITACCVLIAVRKVAGTLEKPIMFDPGFWLCERAESALNRAARARGYGKGSMFPAANFNDAPDTTHADVLAFIRDVAEQTR